MNVKVLEQKTGSEKTAKIERIRWKELPLKKDGWNFSWRQLFRVEGAMIYKIALTETPYIVEGILMLTLFNDEMLFMNNLEAAPYNIGKNKKYDHIAGCLIAFGCKQSFEIGKGHYQGFLSFDSKTELIPLYHHKYGASLAMGYKMLFDSETGKTLINKYLKIK